MQRLLGDLRSTVLALVDNPNLRVSDLTGMPVPVCDTDGNSEMSDFLVLDSALIPAIPDDADSERAV
jgi:hypothetical protein